MFLSINDKLIFPTIKKEILESPMYSSKVLKYSKDILSIKHDK